MTTKLDEIAPDIYRLSTFVPEVGPTGLTFNQFLIVDDDPLLFHTGHRPMFASVREAIERVMPVERLRWITFGHVESDESGSIRPGGVEDGERLDDAAVQLVHRELARRREGDLDDVVPAGGVDGGRWTVSHVDGHLDRSSFTPQV